MCEKEKMREGERAREQEREHTRTFNCLITPKHKANYGMRTTPTAYELQSSK